jgi:hypothetical protein
MSPQGLFVKKACATLHAIPLLGPGDELCFLKMTSVPVLNLHVYMLYSMVACLVTSLLCATVCVVAEH